MLGPKGEASGIKMPSTPEEFREWITKGIGIADVQAANAAFGLYEKITAFELECGNLVKADAAADAMQLWCVEIRERMLQAAGRVAAKGGMLGLDGPRCTQLRVIVTGVISELLNSVRADASKEQE